MFNLATSIFESPDKLHKASKKITTHLFEQSNHPHTKIGEAYVTYLTNVSIDNNVLDAIGIFKSEIKNDYFEINENESRLELEIKQGISLDKLDKGCINFNYKKEEVLFINRSVDYFAKNDDFEESSFLNEVIDTPDLISELKNYKVNLGEK